MAEHPKVFISYSHDSSEHKRWVSELGAKLRHKGVDAILDQWDLGPGDEITLFMESGLRDSDRVLVICTDRYVRKADSGEGGVGYERMIVTAQLIQNLGTNKFIPVIRQASGQMKTPVFLATRMYVDLRDGSQFESEFDKLIQELHQEPSIKKPPLGISPFTTHSSGQEKLPSEGLDTQLPEIPKQVESASHAYSAAVKLARAGDLYGWRQLVKQIKPNVFKSLVQWRRNELDGQRPKNQEPIHVVDEVVDIISPLISVALAGVESGREQFRDQKSTLDDLLNVTAWNRYVYGDWRNLSFALGYVYHSLHGGLSLSTNQIDLALSLAQVKIPVADGTKYLPVWKRSQLRGYSESISGSGGGDCVKSWNYISTAFERWEWLAPIFGDKLEYQSSLVAYYMALNIYELATIIASGQKNILNTDSNPYFHIPLTFASESCDINQLAISLLLRHPESLMELWTSLNVTLDQMKNAWRDWIRLCGLWLRDVYGPFFDDEVYHQHIFEGL